MTTSIPPVRRWTSAATRLVSDSLSTASLRTWMFGFCFARSVSSVAVEGLRAVAKTMVLGREAKALTRPNPKPVARLAPVIK